MNFSTIMNHFTKSKLQELLDKLKDTTYKSSWKKEKLISHLCEYDSKSVLNKLTTTQLKEILQESNMPTNGKKSDLIERLLNGESGSEVLGSATDSTDGDMSDEELLEYGKLLFHVNYYGEIFDEDTFQQFLVDYNFQYFHNRTFSSLQLQFECWTSVGMEYEYIDVNNHRCYATYNRYFVNGDDALVIGCLQEPCQGPEVVSVERVRISKKKVTVYCFDDHVSTLRW